MPQFSIVIPTCRRADTLVHALRSASEQDFDDFEILVHESGDDPATARAVESIVDPRIRHIKTVRRVPMVENWEAALRCAAGTYITFVGDDDGLFPGACSAAAEILKSNPSDLLSWRPACYYWPRYFIPEMRNRLVLDLPRERGVESLDSRSALELVYQFRQNYSELPMIYNSFVSRTLVDRILEKAGRYFIGSAPDVTSGIANAWFSEHFLLSRTPLSCYGLSHNSTGHRLFFSSSDLLWNEATAESLGGNGSPVPMKDLNLYLAGEMLAAKQLLFPEGPPFLNHRNLLWSAVRALNHQVRLQRQGGNGAHTTYDGRTERDVRHEMPVHDVQMQPIRAGGIHSFDLSGKPAEIRSQQRRRYNHGHTLSSGPPNVEWGIARVIRELRELTRIRN